MNSRIFKFIAGLFVAVLLYRCSAALYMPQVSDAEKAGTSLDTLVAGRKLYVAHCGSCHSLFLPEQFTSVQWVKSVDEMQGKAKISNADKELIIDYLKVKCRN